jgi:hypothetical protein
MGNGASEMTHRVLILSTIGAIVGVCLAAWGAPLLTFLPFFGCYFGVCK